MKKEELTLEQAMFMDSVLARLDRANMNYVKASNAIVEYEYKDKEVSVASKEYFEMLIDNFHSAKETYINVIDSICFYRRNKIFTDLMWNEIENVVKNVYMENKKQIEEDEAYSNIRWIIDQDASD